MHPAEELHQLIAHKLRFVGNKPSFLVVYTVAPLQLHSSPIFAEVAKKIGAILLSLDSKQTEPTILICCIPGKTLAEAMGIVPEILQSSYMQANDKITALQEYDPSLLHILSDDVLSKIKANVHSWEDDVPYEVVKAIKFFELFGYQQKLEKH